MRELLRIIAITIIGCTVVIGLGYIHLGLGLIAMVVVTPLCADLLRRQ